MVACATYTVSREAGGPIRVRWSDAITCSDDREDSIRTVPGRCRPAQVEVNRCLRCSVSTNDHNSLAYIFVLCVLYVMCVPQSRIAPRCP